MRDGYWNLIEPVLNRIDIDSAEAFSRTYCAVRPQVALLYAAHFCQSEVCNGGFYQFFSNSTGVLAPEAAQGFRAIGQAKVAGVVGAALDAFGRPYPRDREARRILLTDFTKDHFEVLDDRFFSLIEVENGGFELAADQYALGQE